MRTHSILTFASPEYLKLLCIELTWHWILYRRRYNSQILPDCRFSTSEYRRKLRFSLGPCGCVPAWTFRLEIYRLRSPPRLETIFHWNSGPQNRITNVKCLGKLSGVGFGRILIRQIGTPLDYKVRLRPSGNFKNNIIVRVQRFSLIS